jgi:hypothetical protein
MPNNTSQKNPNNSHKVRSTTAELAKIITPYLLRLLNSRPEHGTATLKLNFRESTLAFIGIDTSVSIIPDTGRICTDNEF